MNAPNQSRGFFSWLSSCFKGGSTGSESLASASLPSAGRESLVTEKKADVQPAAAATPAPRPYYTPEPEVDTYTPPSDYDPCSDCGGCGMGCGY